MAATTAPGSGPTPAPSHLSHVEQLLKELKRRQDGGIRERTPRELYLVKDEGPTFMELIAIRMRGAPTLFVGAVRFQKQGGAAAPEFARRPVSLYLSVPPKELGINKAARPARILEVTLPEAGETISEFQARMQAGEPRRTMFVDTELIEFAFDFRFENPSVEREQGVFQGAPERHLFRTLRGHLLSGISHGLHRRLHQNWSFATLAAPVQHAASGAYLLPPALVLHRSFIAIDAQLTEGDPVGAWLSGAAPFLTGTAQSRHLLLHDER